MLNTCNFQSTITIGFDAGLPLPHNKGSNPSHPTVFFKNWLDSLKMPNLMVLCDHLGTIYLPRSLRPSAIHFPCTINSLTKNLKKL